jgi:hypothetical protein
MPLALNDGYTLTRKTSPEYTDGARQYRDLPIVTVSFRPALPEAIYDWQYKLDRSGSGKNELATTNAFLVEHITGWDVTDKDGRMAPVTVDSLKKIPMPIHQQILRLVTTWAGDEQEKAAGNSSAASA